MCFFKDDEDFAEQKAASPPINILQATVRPATDYTKKKNVFRQVSIWFHWNTARIEKSIKYHDIAVINAPLTSMCFTLRKQYIRHGGWVNLYSFIMSHSLLFMSHSLL